MALTARKAETTAAPDRGLAAEFDRLAAAWEEETAFLSSITEIVSNPHYRAIIGMGKPALPLILDRLRRERDDPDHWFEALAAIAGEDPVPRSAWGRNAEMAEAWLRWADENDVA